MPTGVMACSACANNPDVDITFHIITDESVTSKDKKDLEDTICHFCNKHVVFYDFDSQIVSSYPNYLKNGPSLATYYRLFLSVILPASLDKVLYLDGDIIIRDSLQQLWETDLSGFAIAAVPDLNSDVSDAYHRLQYDPKYGYFNAGVMLINLHYWREHLDTTTICSFIQIYHERILFHDQDVLNYFLRKHKRPLSIRYNFLQDYLIIDNFMKYEQIVLEALKGLVIIHYASSQKPWHAFIQTPHPLYGSFYKYQEQTIWKGYQEDNRTLRSKLKGHIVTLLRSKGVSISINNPYVNIQLTD